jgi:hypothetical protein
LPWLADGAPPEYVWAWANKEIPAWPAPNGPRIDSRFRFNYGEYLPAPRPSKFFVRFVTGIGVSEKISNGWVDLMAVSDTLLQGTIPANAEGYSITFEIELFEDPVKEPFFGKSGIRNQIILHRAGFPDLYWRQLGFAESDGGVPFVTLKLRKEFTVIQQPFDYTNYDPLIHTYVQTTFLAQLFEYFPLSECVVFPVTEEGFAECNGVDSYVLFNTFFPLVATRFKMEFDIRRTGADTQLVAFGYTGFGSFFYGFNDHHNFQWWNQTFFLPDGLVLVDWNHVRIEYDWSIPGGSYSIWIDDVLQITQAGAFVTWVWDEIGRRGNIIAGAFDIKNAKLWDGTPGSPNLLIDVPLTGDACAVVPPTIKGTTFNMMLPSCP